MDTLRTPRGRLVAVFAAAAALAAIFVGASQLTARDGETTPSAPDARAPAPGTSTPSRVHGRKPSIFTGLAQNGAVLGSPKAPVTLVEYADLQCPYCAQWARDALPTLVQKHVRTGKLRIVFRGLAFIGPDSDQALRAVVAAGEQNRLFDVVHALYVNQGHENSGWVTDELVARVATEAGLDSKALLERRWSRAVEREIGHTAAAAQAAGVSSTPSFDLRPTGRALEPIQISSLGPEGVVRAIEAVLAR